MNLWQRLVDNQNDCSLAAAFRRRRFRIFMALMSDLPRPVKVLDVGGEIRFWEIVGLAGSPEFEITLLNRFDQRPPYPNLHSRLGDAVDLQVFPDRAWTVVFSNSVIEHLGDLDHQMRMADEIRRVGEHYFVQTPNRSFPIEPHFLLPFFPYYPEKFQVALVQRFNLGWYRRRRELESARTLVREHRLLTEAELRRLFPDGRIYRERVLGLVKSLVVYL